MTQHLESRLAAAAPDLLAAVKDLLGQNQAVQNGVCQWCGRDYGDDPAEGDCPAEDCPSTMAWAAVFKAEGRQP